MKRIRLSVPVLAAMLATLVIGGCTQESQNQLGRVMQNWTGTDGVLEIITDKGVHMRFLQIDKLSTAYGTSDDSPRPYRYGYGIVDKNLNLEVDPGEEKVYFEFSDYSTQYVFYENYNR